MDPESPSTRYRRDSAQVIFNEATRSVEPACGDRGPQRVTTSIPAGAVNISQCIRSLTILALAIGYPGTAPPKGRIVLQISTRRPLPRATDARTASSPLDSSDHVVAQGPDTIFLRRARLVLADLELAPAVASECGGAEEIEEGNPPCIQFGKAPQVIDLPLDRLILRLAARAAPATDYRLLQIVIYRPVVERDARFIRANPEFAGVSVRVEGTYSASGRRREFAFYSDFTEPENRVLNPSVSLRARDSVHITLRADIAKWFLNDGGTALVDPMSGTPGGPNELLIKDRIRTSFRIFHDEDSDGLDDNEPNGGRPVRAAPDSR